MPPTVTLITFVSPDYLDVLAAYGASHLNLPHGWYWMLDHNAPVGPYASEKAAAQHGLAAAQREKERRAAEQADRAHQLAEFESYVSLPLPLGGAQ